MWILGVVAWGPTPSSHMHHPVDPLLWRSARELIEGFSPMLQRRIFLGSRFLPSIFLFHIPFPISPLSHCSLVLCTCVAQVLCSLCSCKAVFLCEIWILPLSRRLQIWPPPLQPKGSFGSVHTVLLVCLPLLLTTILYALNAGIRYVIWSLFVMNAATGLFQNAKCLLIKTIVLELVASINNARLG